MNPDAAQSSPDDRDAFRPPRCRCRKDLPRLKAVVNLARRCHYEQQHAHQVTRLALALFDELQSLHDFGQDERFLLQCGAMLHDIGWTQGQRRHHKAALRIIIEADALPLGKRERLLVASIARYHRKALPGNRHEHFAALGPSDQQRVRVLAAILRVADGLDRSHQGLVRGLACEISPERIVVRCDAPGPAAPEVRAATAKGNLLEDVFGRKLLIDMAGKPV
ncbi:MAG: HD domain-containing protein [Anaerolineaceae bacterium]|nr:HD domain-containing protein [Anaerolineaceae bacterium]